jgi:hypothetical protein
LGQAGEREVGVGAEDRRRARSNGLVQRRGDQHAAGSAGIELAAVSRMGQERDAAGIGQRQGCDALQHEGGVADRDPAQQGRERVDADLARLRVDTDDALRSATTLRAMLLAEALRAQLRSTLGEAWFRESAAGRALVELWGPGSQVPAEARIAPLSEALRAFSQHTAELTPVGQATDGGLSAQPWPSSTAIITSRLTLDGGWQPRAWPSPKVGLERPWVPRPWPTVTPRTFEDAGVDAGR